MAQCTAKSSQSGQRCRGQAIAGANVCRMHGGSAPQVKRKALERMIAACDIVAGELIAIARDKKQPAAARVSAANSVLDRAGMKPTDRVELSGADGAPVQTEMVVRFVKPDAS